MRIIQIGLGDFGSSWLRDVLLPHPEVAVVGVVDVDDRRRDAAGALGVPHFTDARTALDDQPVDLVLVTTPPDARSTIIREALGRGVPVLCEKPAALTERDAAELLDLVAVHGTPVHIAENYRHRPLFTAARAALGALGPPSHVAVEVRRRHRLDNYHAAVPHPFLLDVASHHTDVVRFLTGRDVVEVSADAWVRPGSWYAHASAASLHGTIAGGARLTLQGSLDAAVSTTDWAGRWTIESEGGTLVIDGGTLTVLEEGAEPRTLRPTEDDGRRALLDAVLHSLRTGAPSGSELEDNLRSLAIPFAAIRSTEHGGHPQPVRLPGPADAPVPRTTPAAARLVSWCTDHAPLAHCHGGEGVVSHLQLLGTSAFKGPVQFVNHTVLPPGSSIGEHRHGRDEELYLVLRGTGSMTADGDVFRVRTGDLVVNQPHGSHALVNDGDTDLELLVVEVALDPDVSERPAR